MATDEARRILATLAGGQSTDSGESEQTPHRDVAYGDCIDRATTATEDFASAAAFLAEGDLTELEAAIERAETDLSTRAERGRVALETLRDLRRAAID